MHDFEVRFAYSNFTPWSCCLAQSKCSGTKLNRQELCYRYGWKFSSNMPDIYISRAGMENKELDQKFTATELGTLKDDLARMEQQNRIKGERIAGLEKTIADLQHDMSLLAEVLARKPSPEEIKTALKTKRLNQSNQQTLSVHAAPCKGSSSASVNS